jgi:GH25 family lysozyme M1 (1,4-beta-N-acetylmuramidase)
LYQDPFFASAVIELQSRGIPYTAYHVVRPDYGVVEQINNFAVALKNAGVSITHLPLILDCELDCGKSQAIIAQVIYDCCHFIEDKYGYKPILYSRANWADTYIGKKHWLNDYYWWIAYYPLIWKTYTKTPALPCYVQASQLLMHQVTDRAKGADYGTASKQVDLSYWRSSVSLVDYIKQHSGQTVGNRICQCCGQVIA